MSDPLVLALIGVYPVPFSFVVGFFLSKWHIRYLAYNGGEQRYPEMVAAVVRKYREENDIDPSLETS